MVVLARPTYRFNIVPLLIVKVAPADVIPIIFELVDAKGAPKEPTEKPDPPKVAVAFVLNAKRVEPDTTPNVFVPLKVNTFVVPPMVIVFEFGVY